MSSQEPVSVGIDFDNTIVCFDGLFREVAVEQGLVPADLPASKTSVRDYLRKEGREPVWTELQGHVYGVALKRAKPFPGVLDFVRRCGAEKRRWFVVSHKTKHPFLGPKHDLHAAAWAWLEDNGFFAPETGLQRDRVFFELSKKEKLDRIGAVGCGVFIDDLPEFLEETGFPSAVTRVLFDPNNEYPSFRRFARARSWTEVAALVAGGLP